MALSDVLHNAESEMSLYLKEQPKVYNQEFNHLLLKYISAVRKFYDMIPDSGEVEMLKKELTEIKNSLDKAIKNIK